MKQFKLWWALSLVLTLTLSACGSSGGAKENAASSGSASPTASPIASASGSNSGASGDLSGELNLYTYRDDLVTSWYPDVIKEFNQKYPNIKVNLSTSKNFADDLKVKISANDVPDLVTLPVSDLQADVIRQYFMPLDDLPFVGDWLGNDLFVVDGKTYGLTYGLVNEGIIYNKKIFNDLGLKAPTTLDELIASGSAIKKAGKIGYVGVSKPGWTYFTYDVLSKGLVDDVQQLQKQMKDSDAPFTEDNPYVKSMNFIQAVSKAGIMEDDTASYDWEPFKKDFQNGKSGMYFGQSSMFAQLTGPGFAEADQGFVPLPYDNSKGPYRVPYSADWGLAISKNTKNPQAAKALFAFLMDTKYADYAKKTGVLSARKSVTIDYPFLAEFEAANPQKVYLKPDVKEYKAVVDKARIDFTKYFAEVGVGVKTPKDEQKALNDAWAKARK